MNWLAKNFRALMPDCQAAIRLQSEALDHPLSQRQRLGLWIHLALCRWCLRYGKHIRFLRTAAQQCDPQNDPKHNLPTEARERIKRRLQSEIKK